MDLDLSDEQRWLSESVGELLARSAEDEAWPALIDFGVLGIASGRDGLGAVELALVGRAIGERLAAVPFIDSAALRYASRDGRAFDDLHSSDAAVALCLLDAGSSWELGLPATATSPSGGVHPTVSGRKAAVDGSTAARELLLLYRDGDARRLALIARDAPGVSFAPAPSIDPSLPIATVALVGAELPEGRVLSPELSEELLARLLAIGGVLAAGEAVGAAARLVELATEYASQRSQFGRPIGSFQALRHLLADMYVKQSSAWSTVLFAAAAVEDGIEDALRTASIAKAYASRATVDVAHGAMQVFGGVAFTQEHPAHRFLRRILFRGAQFGDARHHERAIGRELAAATRAKVAV